MKQIQKIRELGFTLVEMLLVMSIMGVMLIGTVKYSKQKTMAISIDRTGMQMQQILNAGLAYYVNNAKWPTTIADLQPTYIPSAITSPYGTTYTVDGATNPQLFTVSMTMPVAYTAAESIVKILAGKLPYGQVTVGPPAVIKASVNIPGQNLNNLGNVSFAGLYRNGACVPAPSCPTSTTGSATTPQILVVPASVSGMSDAGSTNSYPITSFTAFATALTDIGATGSGPPACNNSLTNPAATECYTDVWGSANTIQTGKYWRVCLATVTSKGDVVWDSTTGEYATVMAVTRCGINTENTGSSFQVWTN